MQNGVYLLLGSNLGNPEENLLQARALINDIGSIASASAIYQTQAWGNTEQPDFLNQVVKISFKDSPQHLLDRIMTIENEMGRMRTERWGPRIIDIDILFFDQLVINEEHLIIPHAGIPLRRFTLLPLAELAPEFIHPLLNKTCAELLSECADYSEVKLFKP